jgi:hypothetical protein
MPACIVRVSYISIMLTLLMHWHFQPLVVMPELTLWRSSKGSEEHVTLVTRYRDQACNSAEGAKDWQQVHHFKEPWGAAAAGGDAASHNEASRTRVILQLQGVPEQELSQGQEVACTCTHLRKEGSRGLCPMPSHVVPPEPACEAVRQERMPSATLPVCCFRLQASFFGPCICCL